MLDTVKFALWLFFFICIIGAVNSVEEGCAFTLTINGKETTVSLRPGMSDHGAPADAGGRDSGTP